MSEKSFIVKLCLLGEANVGKTSLVYRYIENKFRENYKSTLGVNLLKKDLDVEGYGKVSAQVWDLGGQESFRSLRKLYLEGANGAFIIYDMTNKKSFDKLDEWIESFRKARSDNQPILLIGNKSDLTDQLKVSEDEAKNFAKDHQMDLLITSAKNGTNVEKAFSEIITRILDKISELKK